MNHLTLPTFVANQAPIPNPSDLCPICEGGGEVESPTLWKSEWITLSAMPRTGLSIHQ